MRRWLPRALFESALIVLSVLIALGVDEWRDSRARQERREMAVEAIRAELQANRDRLSRAREQHRRMHVTLLAYDSLGATPPSTVFYGGMFNPARLPATAWQSARESGALADLPYDLLLSLSGVYDQQARYQELGDAIIQDVYTDIRRLGGEAVFRDGYRNFLLLISDFATRERFLLERTDSALARLDRKGEKARR